MKLSAVIVSTLLGTLMLEAAGCALFKRPADPATAARVQTASAVTPTGASPTAASRPASAPAPLAVSASAAPEPSPEVTKKAHLLGFTPEKRKGLTVFCRTQINVGSHFPVKRCLTASAFEGVTEQQFRAQQQLREMGCDGGMVCGMPKSSINR